MQMDSSGGEFVNGQMTAVYAPADFPDVDHVEARQPNILLNTVSNVALYHMSDNTDRHQQTKTWKRKVREILQNHQEVILQF